MVMKLNVMTVISKNRYNTCSKVNSKEFSYWREELSMLSCNLCYKIMYLTSDPFIKELKHAHQINWWNAYMSMHIRTCHPRTWTYLVMKDRGKRQFTDDSLTYHRERDKKKCKKKQNKESRLGIPTLLDFMY